MDIIYPWLEEVDALILASPVYFYGLTAQVKAMIDRCQVFWNRSWKDPVKEDNAKKRGALIAVGATRGSKLFEGAILTSKYFFKALGMSYCRELLVRGVEAWGAVREHPEALIAAQNLGRELVFNRCHS